MFQTVVLAIYACVSLVTAVDPCSEHLVTGPFGVPDDHITASSTKVPKDPNLYTGPERARLFTNATKLANGTVLMGAWSPAQNTKKEWLQVELDDYSLMRGVMTQGLNQLQGSNSPVQYTALFYVETSMDGQNWTKVQDNGKDKVFIGNTDSDTVVENLFPCPVFAKYFRIIPEAWAQNITLRVDALGCQVDSSKNQATTTAASQAMTTPIVSSQQATTAQAVTSAPPAVATLAAGGRGACVDVTRTAPCIILPDGDYGACTGDCSTYITCSNGITYGNRPCPAGLKFDGVAKKCMGPATFKC